MKKTKRIITLLLIMAIAVSAFAFSAYADESEENSYSRVLEYYEEPIIFDYDFSREGEGVPTFIASAPGMVSSSIVEDENAPGGKYLALTSAAPSDGWWDSLDGRNNVYLNWNAEGVNVDDFILHMTVSGAGGSGDGPANPVKIVVAISDSAITDADAVSETLIAIDFSAGTLSYFKKTTRYEDGAVYGEMLTVSNFEVKGEEWYDVTITYSGNGDTATATVTELANPENTVTFKDVYMPYAQISNIRVGSQDVTRFRESVMKVSKLLVIGGKYDRVPSNCQSDVENTVLDMYSEFIIEDVELSYKRELSELAKKFVGYGFSTENEEVKNALDTLLNGIIPFCNNKLLDCINTDFKPLTYLEKRALVDEALIYVEHISLSDSSDVDPDFYATVEENVATIKSLDQDLKDAEQKSKGLMAAVGMYTNIDFAVYDSVKSAYDNLKVYEGYDPTYVDIESDKDITSAHSFYSDVKQTEEEIRTHATAFIDGMDKIGKLGLGINVRAAAFLTCKEHYPYLNDTYPGVSSKISQYVLIVDYWDQVISDAENFIMYVKQAEFAQYIPEKVRNLEEAAKYKNCESEYAGVAEAKALYNEIKATVDEQIKNAKAYVDAVNALDGLSGEKLEAAIKVALELKKTGDILGGDGVADANIKLNKLVSSIELAEKYNSYFVSLVDSISSANSTADLYRILVSCKKAEKDADPAYASVAEASEKLAKAVNDYNGQAALANAEFKKANEVAANTCGIGKGVNPVADHVIALIKKFFED